MSEPKINYLGPACGADTGERRMSKHFNVAVEGDDGGLVICQGCKSRGTYTELPAGECPTPYKSDSLLLAESMAREQALQLMLNDRDEQLHTLEQSRRAHFENAQAAERRIDELASNTGPGTPVCKGSAALGTACGKCARCLAPLGEVKFKGMIETACGTFAIMIDEANGHYGWTFQRHPDGMWVSGRKATEAEMSAARAHAKILALF